MSGSRVAPVWQVAARLGFFVAAAGCLAAFHSPHRPATLCLFRACTGLPCPLCGSTTAAVRVGQGQPLRALAASPLAIFGTAILTAWPLVPGAVVKAASRFRNQLVFSVLTASELWQLHRFL